MKRWILLLLLLLVVTVTGCGSGEQTELKAELASMTKNLRGRVETLPIVKPYEPLPYEAYEFADPFNASKLILAFRSKGIGGPDFNRVREPLEAYALESLKMVGVLQQNKRTYALIKADMALYKVQVGNYIGQNYGLVTRIDDAQLNLKEMVQDAVGDWAERDNTLMLQEVEASK